MITLRVAIIMSLCQFKLEHGFAGLHLYLLPRTEHGVQSSQIQLSNPPSHHSVCMHVKVPNVLHR